MLNDYLIYWIHANQEIDITKILMSLNNVGFKGRKHTEETKLRMSEKRKGVGRPHSEETRKKLSEIAKKRFSIPENNPMFGKHHSEKTRKLISKIKSKKSNS